MYGLCIINEHYSQVDVEDVDEIEARQAARFVLGQVSFENSGEEPSIKHGINLQLNGRNSDLFSLVDLSSLPFIDSKGRSNSKRYFDIEVVVPKQRIPSRVKEISVTLEPFHQCSRQQTMPRFFDIKPCTLQ